jgi:hypothetical protein
LDSIGGGAGGRERTALSLRFPANREFNREILQFWLSLTRGVAWHAAQFTVPSRQWRIIGAQKEQGIVLRYQGIEVPFSGFEQRIFIDFSAALSRKTPQIPTT